MEGFSAAAASTIASGIATQSASLAAQITDVIGGDKPPATSPSESTTAPSTTAPSPPDPSTTTTTPSESTTAPAAPAATTPTSKLAFLSIRLQQLTQHAHQLAEALLDAKAVAPSVQAGLSLVLPEGDAEVGRLGGFVGEVKGGGENGEGEGGVLDGKLEGWSEVVAAYSRVVIFATQILSIDDETEQANRMEHDEAKELFAAPGVVRKRV